MAGVAKRMVVLAALTLAALLLPPVPARAAPCGHAVGPFHQANAQIWQANGRRYVPLGITVSGLEHANWRDYTAVTHDQVTAAAQAWCANTVRLQISQHLMITNAAFVAEVKAEVAYAESLGLVVVINDQSQHDPPDFPGMPTQDTKTFWRRVAPLYAHDGQVVFDIFNEPRGPGKDWACWHDGGSACSGPGFVGMQRLAALVRRNAPNLMWVEGPNTATTLSQVPSWPITGARPMAYAITHPSGARTRANWNAKFGYLANRRIAPVVDAEWTNWAAARAECWPDAPTKVPVYLDWLAAPQRRIGMTAWSLDPGVLVDTDPAVPTGFGANWRCVDGQNPNHSAGKKIMAWYKQLNG
jgi:cellulase (glycosyl hydrolase family 5)